VGQESNAKCTVKSESVTASSLDQVTDFLEMLRQGSKQLYTYDREFYRPDLHGITQASAGFQG